jgi:hypothetical protein
MGQEVKVGLLLLGILVLFGVAIASLPGSRSPEGMRSHEEYCATVCPEGYVNTGLVLGTKHRGCVCERRQP